MKRHFHDELMSLKNKLLRMGLLVEGATRKAFDSLMNRDADLAREVIEGEHVVNQMEIEVDEDGHGLLVLEQPVAIDMRLLAMILKINKDLERMGDHAVNIAERTIRVLNEPHYETALPLREMAQAAMRMLKNALDAFIYEDIALARQVLGSDDVVDNYNEEIYHALRKLMEEDSKAIGYGINLAMVAYNLERIADLASNIAEDVIYIKQGREVRHHAEETPPA